jgi:hypothetical protein
MSRTSWFLPTVTRRRHRVLSSAAEGIAVRAAGTGHRQAGQLRCGPPTADLQRGTPPIPMSKQPAENSHQPTRARERARKRFQSVGRAHGSYPRLGEYHCTSDAPPTVRQRLPPRNDIPLRYLERRHRPFPRRADTTLTRATCTHDTRFTLNTNNLTVPGIASRCQLMTGHHDI